MLNFLSHFCCLVLIFACPSLIAAANDDPYQLLVAVNDLGLLQSDPANSLSRNNYDKVYQDALLKFGRFNEAIAYENPNIVNISKLNRICLAMASVGKTKEAIKKLTIFENQGHIARIEDFENALQPGLLSGQLLFAIKKGETEKAVKLADKVLEIILQDQTIEVIRDSTGASLYGHLVLCSLFNEKTAQAAELFDLTSKFGKRQTNAGYHIVDHLRIKHELTKAVGWLEAISDKNTELSIHLAARYLGQYKDPIWRYRNRKSEDKTRDTMLSFIRKQESKLGRLVDIQARARLLEKSTTPESEKRQIESEFIRAVQLSSNVHSKLQLAIMPRSKTKIELLNPLVNLSNSTARFYYRRHLIDAYVAVGDFSTAKLEFSKLRLKTNSKDWFEFGKLAARCKEFKIAREILDANRKRFGTEKGTIRKLNKLELCLIANESNFTVAQPTIDFFKRCSEDQFSTLFHYFESDEILGEFVRLDHRVGEQIIAGIPDELLKSSFSRSFLQRSLLHSLLENGKIEEAESFVQLHDRPMLQAQLIRYYFFIGNVDRVKELVLNHLQNDDPESFIWNVVEPEWLDDCVAAIAKHRQESLVRFLNSSAWGLQKFKDVELIVRLADLIKNAKDRGRFLLSVADYWETGDITRSFEFPMKLANSTEK